MHPEQVIRKLREADKLLAEGADIATVVRHLEVSEQTFHRWRNQYGGMKADNAKRLKELELDAGRSDHPDLSGCVLGDAGPAPAIGRLAA